VKRTVSYRWRPREIMAGHGMFSTTELVPLLADRDITLSASQVRRLVTGTPERLSLPVLAALCDIFEITPADLTGMRCDVRRSVEGSDGLGSRTASAWPRCAAADGLAVARPPSWRARLTRRGHLPRGPPTWAGWWHSPVRSQGLCMLCGPAASGLLRRLGLAGCRRGGAGGGVGGAGRLGG
jgi:DNA-binding Xre family transcriptional regulator